MSTVGQPERATQNRIIALFREELHYRFLGDWTDRNNNNIEENRKRCSDHIFRPVARAGMMRGHEHPSI
jgi:type I restriction enzyme R subunit